MERLHKEFPGLTVSVFTPVLNQVNGNVDAAIKLLRPDTISEEADRGKDLSEDQKIRVMKVVLGDTWNNRDRDIMVALRANNGDVNAAANALYVQPALPPPPSAAQPPEQQSPTKQQAAAAAAPVVVVVQAKPLGDRSLENAAKREQMEIVERQRRELEALQRAREQEKAAKAAAATSPAMTTPPPKTPPTAASITMSKLPEEYKAQKAELVRKVEGLVEKDHEHMERERALEHKVEALSKMLQDAESKAEAVKKEVQSAKEGHRDVLEKDALARQKAMLSEKTKLMVELEGVRKQMEELAHEQRARLEAREHEAQDLKQKLERAVEEKTKLECGITCVIEAKAGALPGTVEVTWNIKELPLSSGDWIGLFIRNRQFSNKYTDYRKTEGTESGSVTFTGLKPGFYDARFFLEGKNDRDFRRSQPVLVGPEVLVHATLEYVPQERRRNIRVTWVDKSGAPSNPKDWVGMFLTGTHSNKKYLDSKYIGANAKPSEGLLFAAPHTVGDFEFRYFKAESGYISSSVPALVPVVAQDGVTVDTPTIAPGNTLHVHWECHTKEPSASDWIGIFTPSAPDTAYLRSSYCVPYPVNAEDNGYYAGELTFDLGGQKPLVPGNYEVRFFSSSVSKYVHQPFFATFTVTSPTMSGH